MNRRLTSNISNISLCAVAVIFAITLFPQVTVAGFGVSPPNIMEDHLVRGARIERTIYLVQGNPEEDITMEILIDSPDITEWISFEGGRIFTIPKGVQQYPLVVQIQVPQDAEFNIYKAFLRINTVPKSAEEGEGGNQVAIVVGGRVDVNLTVGEGLFEEYSIERISILDIKTGANPKVSLTINNTGNVSVAPYSASFELYNKFGNIRLGYGENDGFEKVPAFSKSSIEIEFPIGVRLAEGEYWGHIKIYDDKSAVIKELRTVFNVKKSGFGLTAGVGSVSSSIIFSIIGVIVLGVVFIIIKRVLRKKNTKKRRKK